ncbi:hypothetical protein WDW86_02505 [Bdellovibrionota bacterium FG-2]
MENIQVIPFLTLLLVLGSAELLAAEPDELRARYVDRVALQSQDKAIEIFSAQIRKRKGFSEEPHDLARLADLYLEKAELLFRISYGKNQSVYDATLRRGIKVLGELFARFPKDEDTERTLFLRARSFSELGVPESAKADYLRLLSLFPLSQYRDACSMAIAEIEITANRHLPAVVQLQSVVSRKESPYLALALHKLAWSHYNLGQSIQALSVLAQNIRVYQAEVAKVQDGSSSGFMDNSLSDYALFYLDAFERKVIPFDAQAICEHFIELQPGPRAGKLILSFAKLLGAHGHLVELAQFRDVMVHLRSKLPSMMEVCLFVLDLHLSQRKFVDVEQDLKTVVSLALETDSEQKGLAFAVLSKHAVQLHALVVRNKEMKNSAEFQPLARGLIEVYTSLMALQAAADPKRVLTRYNLAQAYFLNGEMSQATREYRLVFEETLGQKAVSQEFLERVSLLLISSRFQELKVRGLIPEKLQAMRKPASSAAIKETLLLEWGVWVDDHQKRFTSRSVGFENFEFELARALYSSGQVEPAMERMKRFASDNPTSPYASAAMGLVLDTLVESELWAEVVSLTRSMAPSFSWPIEFRKRALAAGASASIMLIESRVKASASKAELDLAQEEARKCSETFSQSPKVVDCLLLEARAAYLLSDFEHARHQVKSVLDSTFSSEVQISSALLLKAAMNEEEGDFAHAVEGLLAVLKKSSSMRSELSKRAIRLAWLSGNSDLMGQVLQRFRAELGEDFELYSALRTIQYGANHRKEDALACFRKAYKGSAHFKSLWALSALKNAKHLPFQDALVALKRLSEQWSGIPQEVQLALAGELHRLIPRVLGETRQQMHAIARVHFDEASLERRMLIMTEWEAAVTSVLKLPWEGIKMSALEQLALGYQDLTEALRHGLGSEGQKRILIPLEAKRLQILVELKKRQAEFAAFSDFSLTSETLSPEAWVAPGTFKTAEQKRLVSLWALALKDNNTAWLFSLATHANSNGGFDEDTQQVLRALALIASEARAEGWMILSKRGAS